MGTQNFSLSHAREKTSLLGLGQFKYRVKKQKFQNLPHDTLCLSFSCNLIGYFKQALNLIGCFVFSEASSLAGRKMRFKAKNGAIRE